MTTSANLNYCSSSLAPSSLPAGMLPALGTSLETWYGRMLSWQSKFAYTLKSGFENSLAGVSLALGKLGMHCWASDGCWNHRHFGWYPHSETSRAFSHLCFKNNTEPFPSSSVGRYFETDLPNTLKRCNCTDSERRYKDLLVFGYKVNTGLKYMSICPKPNNLRAESECSLKNFRVVLR